MHPRQHPHDTHPSYHTISRGIALLPDTSHSSRFIELQSAARETLETGSPLSLSGNLPHITLVQGAFPKSTDFSLIINTAAASLSTNALTTVMPTRLVYKPRGWIFLEIEMSTARDSVHRSIADIAATSLIAPTDLTKMADYSEGEKESYRRFGYRYMYDTFYPHLTLGGEHSKPSPQQIEHLTRLAQKLDLLSRCPLAKVTVYEMGEHGAHARTILMRDV